MLNRKKALVLILGLQMMLLALLVVLYVSGSISMYVFVPLVVIVGAVFSGFTIVAVRKFPPM
jgi:hypothetical protein